MVRIGVPLTRLLRMYERADRERAQQVVRKPVRARILSGAEGGAPRIRYSRSEAARQLSISERTLDKLREEGKLIGRVDGRRVFFDRDELVSYAKSCRPEGEK